MEFEDDASVVLSELLAKSTKRANIPTPNRCS